MLKEEDLKRVCILPKIFDITILHKFVINLRQALKFTAK